MNLQKCYEVNNFARLFIIRSIYKNLLYFYVLTRIIGNIKYLAPVLTKVILKTIKHF